MQRLLISIFVCVLVLLNLFIAAPVQAQSLVATSSSLLGNGIKQPTQIAVTPEKQELIMKKKEMFKPSAEEIEEKINAKLKMKPDVANKPTAKQIGEKISEKLKMFKNKMGGE